MRHLHEIIDRSNLREPDAPAFLGRESITYLRLRQVSCQLANLIDSQTTRTSEPIGLAFADELLEIVATIAMSLAGRRCVSLPRTIPPEHRLSLVDRLRVRQIVADRTSDIPPAAVGIRASWEDIEGFPTEYTGTHPPPVDGRFLTVTSSGSTGSPKVFELTHSMILERLEQRVRFFGIDEKERFLRLSSNSYLGSKIRVLSVLRAGGSVIIGERSTESIPDLCERFEVSFLSAIVLQAEQLLGMASARLQAIGSKLRVLELSASHVPDDLRARISRGLTRNIYVTYSTNETGAISIASPDDVASTSMTVGRSLPNVETKIIDGHGNETGDEVGLICARTTQMITSYLDSRQTRRHFHGGFFITGDIGRRTSDGQIVCIGRGDDMMIFNGINIYPSEIEEAFKRHPAVKDVKAWALPHRIHQHIPICVVSLREGASSTESELIRFGLRNLGSKAPRKILIVEELPRNDLGKLDHARITAMIRERLADPETQRHARGGTSARASVRPDGAGTEAQG